ncbi:transcriptional regulator sdnM [Colletotrichum liriopes]|uniref:Transcriptional regulator sdnM n=1 Tax=Colletotrichum liriopes TaxID=708192 RepID=A0AA37GKF0_9PEZI|nr:transcriptional regulator sdnM [Colletotrichum liriopes]
MFGFFSNQAKAPQRVPTDRVVPVGFFDDTILFRTFVMYTMFVFDDVLDVLRLRGALESVVGRPGWNKLGARIRRNDRGELEHHIPEAFSTDRPAIGYYHVDLSDTAVGDHPSGSRIPRPPSNGRPAVVGDPGDLYDLVHGPGIPTELNDYLYQDRPELGLRIVSFKNATVIVLYWMHLSFDAVAEKCLFEAWTLALQGRDGEILTPLATEDYALENVGKNPAEPYVLIDRCLSMPGLVSWVARNVYSLAICSKEHRMVCMPAEYLKRLREKALEELTVAAIAEGTTVTPFLSEGDILVAWATRLAMSNLSKDSERLVSGKHLRRTQVYVNRLAFLSTLKVVIQQAYQWRSVLKDLIPPDRPFLSNCVGTLVALTTVKELAQRPLSYLASQIRQAVIKQGSREQVEAYASLVRQDPRNKAPPFLGASSMQFISFTNCQKANMFGIDMSAAAVKPRSTPLLPSYVQMLHGPYNFTNGIIIVGKDAKGNYWLSGYGVKGLWEIMERKMATEDVAMMRRSQP